MKKALSLWLSLLLLLLPLLSAAEGNDAEEGQTEEAAVEETADAGEEFEETAAEEEAYWVEYNYRELTVGNPTKLQGRFFTTRWGGSTSDLDVQELLHGYNLIKWDASLGHVRFDRSVVSGAVIADDEAGNRTYYLALCDDLKYSDGTPITAYDYAFSMLLQMDPAVAETGGRPMDASWLAGSEEYLSGEASVLSGLRVTGDYQLRFTAKADSLPYFYELARMDLKPYPIAEIAPGNAVRDDGKGVYLTEKLTAEQLRETVLNEQTGYLTHPKVVSGPFTLTGFDGTTASFHANNEYKGNEKSQKPRLFDLHYTLADNQGMIEQLGNGEFGLLNKVTLSKTLYAGIKLAETQGHQYTMKNYPRTGLTLLWFSPESPRVQELAVRQAFAYCLDTESFVRSYVGPFGIAVDGYYGIGEWMYAVANGTAAIAPTTADPSAPAETQADEDALTGWEQVNLDGLTRYPLNVDRAVELLEENGWTLGENGESYDPQRDTVRCKRIGDELVKLAFTVAMPASQDAKDAMEQFFLPALHQAGMDVTVRFLELSQLQEMYAGGDAESADIIYLGENFSIVFNPEVFHPGDGNSALDAVHAELYSLALDMVRTDKSDALGFMQKWVRLQERITQTLPLIPIYSNVYFDFHTRELYDYQINDAVTWSEAIISAYMSDPESLDAETDEGIEEELEEMELLFDDESDVDRQNVMERYGI